MNRKHINEDISVENGEYAVRHRRKRDVVAAVICLLLALVVWLLVMNVDDTAQITLEVADASETYTYTLSDESLEVTGAVVALKQAKQEGITVKLPEGATLPGCYTITPNELILPEGVALTALPELTLTVTPR